MEFHRRVFVRNPRRFRFGHGVLIEQVRVFRSTGHAEVLHLHHLGQNLFLEVIFQRWSSEIAFINIFIFVLNERKGERRNERKSCLTMKKAPR